MTRENQICRIINTNLRLYGHRGGHTDVNMDTEDRGAQKVSVKADSIQRKCKRFLSPGTRQNVHDNELSVLRQFSYNAFVRIHCISLYKDLQSAIKHLLVNHSPYRQIRKKMHSLFITEKNTRDIFSSRTEFKVLAIKTEILTLYIPHSMKRLSIQSFKNGDFFLLCVYREQIF